MVHQTEIRLLNDDCVKGMAEMSEKSVDLCVTSPPYNLGIKYSRYRDDQDRREYLKWTRVWAASLRRILADEGSLFLNVGATPSNPMLPHEILFELKDLFVLQNTIHWIKAITIETRKGETVSAGHFKPLRSKKFLTDCHEYVFHLTKNGNSPINRLAVGVPYTDKSNIKRWLHTKGEDKRCRGNTWFIPYQTIHSKKEQRPHPASFPKELPKMCIRLHGWRNDLVMIDPFLGIGNSALAALECGVARFIGFEIDEVYLRRAEERLAETCRSTY